MSITKETERVEHGACGRRVVELMTVPRLFAVTAFEDTSGDVFYESSEEMPGEGPGTGSIEHLGYWCSHCVRFVPEDELVPVWGE